MRPAEWARVKEVVADALERPETERAAFLDEACGPDTRLRAEVERLLASEESGSLESPLGGALSPAPELAAGQVLGHFRIESRIGQGGMGAVYRARDEQLQRTVAIKVLADGRLSNPASRQRFLREARAASALNHPGIVTIHEVASDDGFDFIAMELVDGESLDRRIPRKGLPLKQALDYAVQVAAALAKAHAAGIIHRDLKPSNVMVTPEGRVKLLDFGLARRVHTGDGSGSTMTRAGEIMGTPAYMSPEQAEGKAVDARSDIFSFGSLLYEMVSGRKAFHGDSEISTLAAVLQTKPEPLDRSCPAELVKLIGRCQQKDPAHRLQVMADVQVELEELRGETEARKRRKGRRIAWATAAAVAAVLGTSAWLLMARWARSLPQPYLTPFTSLQGSETRADFSPDGSRVAFTWNGEKQDNADIYVKRIGAESMLRLTNHPAPDTAPAWAPDGERVAFVRGGGVYVVDALGGTERRLVEEQDTKIAEVAWHPKGQWIAVSESTAGGGMQVSLIPLAGGTKRPLLSGPAFRTDSPVFSPDGEMLAFGNCSNVWMCDLHVQNLDAEVRPDGPLRRITRQNVYLDGVTWALDGRSLIYSASQSVGMHRYLWRVPVDGSKQPERIELAGVHAYRPVAARVANRMVYTSGGTDRDIWRWQRDGEAELFIASTLHDDNPQYSPDGARIAFASSREGDRQEIWVCNKDGSGAMQLTNRIGRIAGSPRWSPDGRTIILDAQLESGHMRIFAVDASGGPARQVSVTAHDECGPSYSHDGKWIYFRSNPTGRFEIYRMPVGGGTKERITESGGYTGLESYDGRTLYFTVGASTVPTSLMEKPMAGGPVRKVADNIYPRAFAPVAGGVYYIARRQPRGWALGFYSFKTRSTKTLLEIDAGVFHGLSVSPDEKTFLYTAAKPPKVDLMLVENFR